jgi:ADP-ribose pyrophosphatase YjhB (NUDIX family)
MSQGTFARFNPETPPPQGGFCVSVFLTINKESSILLGKIGDAPLWSERWGLGLKNPERWRDKWQLPGTYLFVGEHPQDAAKRISLEQLELEKYDSMFSQPKIFATKGENSLRPGTIHSDLFFVYDTIYNGDVKRPPHFSELKFVEISRLPELSFGRGHDDVLRLCGYF